MNSKAYKLIESFSEIVTYTLAFSSDPNDFKSEKVVSDYESLIIAAKTCFKDNKIEQFWEESFFAIAAWVDEQILLSEWFEKDNWLSHMLQKKYFNTANAGIEFFKKYETIPSSSVETKLLYLYVMYLGFKGYYYYEESDIELHRLIQEETVKLKNELLTSFPDELFAQAYKPEEKKAPTKENPLTKKITVILFLIFLLLLLIYTYDFDLSNELQNIQTNLKADK